MKMSQLSLHPSWEQRVAMVDEAVRMLERFEKDPASLTGSGYQWIAKATQPSEWSKIKEAVSSLKIGIEEKGDGDENLGELLTRVLEPAARLSTDDTAPGYMAYIPSGGLFHSAVADFLGSALNRYVTIHDAAPGLAAIEHECIDWMCRELIGWDGSGAEHGGVLTSGGSFATLVGIHAARRNAMGNDQLPRATIYVSEQAHCCIDQAARFLGLQPKNVRTVPSDKKTFKMDTHALRSLIQQDLTDGLVPIAVCATAGTTNTGSCDDVQACADICAEFGGIWLHVDAAYGGTFALTTEGRRALGPLELANSVVIDPHKGLFMPYGLGAVLVRDQNKLAHANEVDGVYLPPQLETTGTISDIMSLSPELTRDFRGLKMWLPLKVLGTSTFREALHQKMELASMAAHAIDGGGIPNLRVVVPPELSIFAFKLDAPHGSDMTGEEVDQLNIDFLEEINKKGNVLLSPFRSITDTPGEFSIRMAILSHKTDRATVEAAVSEIIEAAKFVTSKGNGMNIPSKSLLSRSSSIERAHQDPVSDYRILAELPIWSGIMVGHNDGASNFRALDVCSGTGRWMQAFADMVLEKKESRGTACAVDFVDLCGESLSVLEQRRVDLLANGTLGPGDISVADACVLPLEQVGSYDLVTNMHGLYGFAGIRHKGDDGESVTALQAVLKRMILSLKPGGTLVIAIAHRDSAVNPSFYDRIGRALADMGVTDAPYICAEDVLEVFALLGIECEKDNSVGDGCPHDTSSTLTMKTLDYSEEISADDNEALHRFILEESGANSFPTTFDSGGSMGEQEVASHLLALAEKENLDQAAGMFNFSQRVGVFTFRQSALLPDIISGHLDNKSFYNDAYTVRRQASSQHSNAMSWLKNNAENLLTGDAASILSIGCGNGELELALLDGYPDQVNFLGLEPSDDMRSEFIKNISKRGGEFRSNKNFTLSDAKFSLDSGKGDLVERFEPFDLVILGHVLYYFDNPAAIVKRARQLTKEGGRVIVVHQSAEGIPDIQETITPALRGCTAHMLTSKDIEAFLEEDKEDMTVEGIPALLDLSEVIAGTEVGMQIMSFTLEVDLRNASESVLHQCRRSFVDSHAFVQDDVDGVGPHDAVGPFVREPVSIISLTGLAEMEDDRIEKQVNKGQTEIDGIRR